MLPWVPLRCKATVTSHSLCIIILKPGVWPLSIVSSVSEQKVSIIGQDGGSGSIRIATTSWLDLAENPRTHHCSELSVLKTSETKSRCDEDYFNTPFTTEDVNRNICTHTYPEVKRQTPTWLIYNFYNSWTWLYIRQYARLPTMVIKLLSLMFDFLYKLVY